MKKLATYLFILGNLSLAAQIGGLKSYSFLSLPGPARANALSGAAIAIWDNDVNLGYGNPALLHPGSARQLSFNHVNFVSDLNYGNFAWARQLKQFGTMGLGLQYFSYGKFDGRDEYDVSTGTFKAADYSLNISIAKPVNKDSSLSIGATLKTIYSHYESYSSVGNAVDVGLTYHDKKNMVISLLAKNYGRMWKSYSTTGTNEPLPFDLQLGFSKKVSKAPFRLIVQYDQLLKWDLTYTTTVNQSTSDPFGTQTTAKTDKEIRNEKISKGLDRFGRHITLATEIILGKNVFVRVGYNFRKGKELSLPDKRAVNGFSAGFGVKIMKFHFNYAYSKYALNGNSHTFGITTNLNYFHKK